MVIIAPKLLDRLSIVINIGAMTVWPFIIARDELGAVHFNHESIHLRQQVECMVFGLGGALALGLLVSPLAGILGVVGAYLLFFLLYGIMWLVNRVRMSGPDAYRAIPFEKEAYENEGNLDYLGERKLFAWLRG